MRENRENREIQNTNESIFKHPIIVYTIAWFIDDHKTYYNFGLTCKTAGKATKYWQKVKQTQFSKEFKDFQHPKILPNGEYHGYWEPNSECKNWYFYFDRGLLLEGCPPYLRYGPCYQRRLTGTGAELMAQKNKILIQKRDVEIAIHWCSKCDVYCYYGIQTRYGKKQNYISSQINKDKDKDKDKDEYSSGTIYNQKCCNCSSYVWGNRYL